MGGGGGWCLNPILVFSLSLSQAEQLLPFGQYGELILTVRTVKN